MSSKHAVSQMLSYPVWLTNSCNLSVSLFTMDCRVHTSCDILILWPFIYANIPVSCLVNYGSFFEGRPSFVCLIHRHLRRFSIEFWTGFILRYIYSYSVFIYSLAVHSRNGESFLCFFRMLVGITRICGSSIASPKQTQSFTDWIKYITIFLSRQSIL